MKLDKRQTTGHGNRDAEGEDCETVRSSTWRAQEGGDASRDPQTCESKERSGSPAMQSYLGNGCCDAVPVTALSGCSLVSPSLQREPETLRQRPQGREQCVGELRDQHVPIVTVACVSAFVGDHNETFTFVE